MCQWQMRRSTPGSAVARAHGNAERLKNFRDVDSGAASVVSEGRNVIDETDSPDRFVAAGSWGFQSGAYTWPSAPREHPGKRPTGLPAARRDRKSRTADGSGQLRAQAPAYPTGQAVLITFDPYVDWQAFAKGPWAAGSEIDSTVAVLDHIQRVHQPTQNGNNRECSC
jgi:hypothetical protein